MVKQHFKILRYNPGKDAKPYYQQYTLPVKNPWSVLDCLHEIQWHHDATLSFRRSCTNGICGSCAVNINGKNMLACETRITDLKKKTIMVNPLPYFDIIKDLVVDLEPFFNAILSIKPYIISKGSTPPDREVLQSPEERMKIDGLYECILCGGCTSSCPSFWNAEYKGPAALLKLFRFVADSRDDGRRERLAIANRDDGVWHCHTIFNCVEACPKGLNPTAAIQQLKRAIVRDSFVKGMGRGRKTNE